jgi:hypothetical protein
MIFMRPKDNPCKNLYDNYLALLMRDNYTCMPFLANKDNKLYESCINNNLVKHQQKYLEYKKCMKNINNFPKYFGNY